MYWNVLQISSNHQSCSSFGGLVSEGGVLKRRRFKAVGFRALGNLRLFKMIGEAPIERHAKVLFTVKKCLFSGLPRGFAVNYIKTVLKDSRKVPCLKGSEQCNIVPTCYPLALPFLRFVVRHYFGFEALGTQLAIRFYRSDFVCSSVLKFPFQFGSGRGKSGYFT